MKIKELKAPIPMLTPLGMATARLMVVWSSDDYATFVCFQEETGENWWWPNPFVRIDTNISGARYGTSPIHVPDEMFEELKPHILRHKGSPLYERASQ